MFEPSQPSILVGILLGFASSIHCFGMCSGIAASLQIAAVRSGAASVQIPTALLLNIGRVTGYALAGAAVGAAGSRVFGALDHPLMNIGLRWAATATLGAVGLSMMGALPLPSFLHRAGFEVSDRLNTITTSLRLPRPAGLMLSGMAWGFCPCAMVYGALVYAMLSGTWTGGTLVMLGFGLGTMPALLAAGLGLASLKHRATSVRLQQAVGIALVFISLASVAIPAATLAEWCRTG